MEFKGLGLGLGGFRDGWVSGKGVGVDFMNALRVMIIV